MYLSLIRADVVFNQSQKKGKVLCMSASVRKEENRFVIFYYHIYTCIFQNSLSNADMKQDISFQFFLGYTMNSVVKLILKTTFLFSSVL